MNYESTVVVQFNEMILHPKWRKKKTKNSNIKEDGKNMTDWFNLNIENPNGQTTSFTLFNILIIIILTMAKKIEYLLNEIVCVFVNVEQEEKVKFVFEIIII